MSLFNWGKKATSQTTSNASTPSQNSSQKVILTKAQDGLNRQLVNLKKTGVDLDTHRARVFVVMDRSGSMNSLYYDGSVQAVLTRLLPLALKFDDNGELEVYVFNTVCHQLAPMTMANYENYVENEILGKGYCPIDGTRYAPVITQTIADYDDGNPCPAFGIFITDGENSDHAKTDTAVRKSSEYKIFYQFVGIGYERFQYLKKLDDLTGRSVDNTAFVKVTDLSQLTDDELYAKLLEQYPQWLRAMRLI